MTMRYQVPRGTQDILPKDISKWHKLEAVSYTHLDVYKRQASGRYGSSP